MEDVECWVMVSGGWRMMLGDGGWVEVMVRYNLVL